MAKVYWAFEWELLVKDIEMDLELIVKDEDFFWDDIVFGENSFRIIRQIKKVDGLFKG